MLYFRMGSQLHRLVTILSVVGEFPMCSLYLLGNERVYKALVHKLTKQETIRNVITGEELTCRLFTVTGKAKLKSIRLYKGALPILNWIHSDAYRYYMASFWNHRFPGDLSHLERNHRVAEAVAFCLRARLEFRQYMLPILQNQDRLELLPEEPVFYQSKDLKRIGGDEMNKTMFTRLVGALFCGNSCYAVYNTRNAVMKWSGMGEFKTLHHLLEIGRLNGKITTIDSAMLIGEDYSVAMDTLLESGKNRRLEFRFDSIYRHIHFIPMDESGIRLFHIMILPDWKNRLLDLMFEPESRSYGQGYFEYDAYIDGVYIFSHLDSDLARLMRFREAVQSQYERYEVVCFTHQMAFVREYLGDGVGIKTIDLDTVEAALGPERRRKIEC